MIAGDGAEAPVEAIVEAAIALCRLAGETHAAGLSLRGLDPDGIVLSPGGEWKVAYVGVGPGRARARVLSPEERRGEPPSPASDVYAIAKLIADLSGGKRSLEPVAEAIRRGTAERPEDRQRDPEALAEALEDGLARIHSVGTDRDDSEPARGAGIGLRFLRSLAFVLLLASLFLLSSQAVRFILTRH